MRAPTQGDPTEPIFHLLASGVTLGRRGLHWVNWGSWWIDTPFEYQHLGITQNHHVGGVDPARDPNVSGFVLQCNIDFTVFGSAIT